MVLPETGYLLRIFIGENDRHGDRPLHEWLVIRAKERGLAGATVLRGIMGFGRNSRIHSSKTLRLSVDLPVVVEFVDTKETLEAFLAEVDPVIREGLATLERAEIRFYRGGREPG